MTVQIWHNPRCSKSRETLKLLEDKKITPEVFLYLEQKPDANSITQILTKLAIPARDLLRKTEQSYKSMNLSNKDLSEKQLIEAMAKDAKLIQRPIVINHQKARLGRPPEQVLEIL